MKPYFSFFYLLLFLISVDVSAQDNIDSLKNLTHTQEVDSIASRLYFEIATIYFQNQNDSCYTYLMKSLDYADRSNNKKLLSKSNLLAAKLNFALEEVDSALYYCDLSQDYARAIHDSSLILKGFWVKGYTYRKMGKKSEAFHYLRMCAQLALKRKDTVLASDVFVSMSNAFTRYSQFDSSLFYLLKSRKFRYQLRDTLGLGQISLNLSNVYIKMGEYELAKKEVNKSILINKRYHQQNYLGLLYNRMGMLMLIEEQYDEALIYFDSSMTIIKELKMYSEEANLYTNIGVALIKQEKYDEALEVYKQLHKINTSINFVNGELNRLINIGIIYEGKEQFGMAQLYNDSALDLSRSLGNTNAIKQIYFNKFKDYELSKDFEKAFEYQTLYYEVKDSLFNLEKTKFIKDLEYKYDREKKDADILKLKHQALKKDARLKTYQYQLTVGIILAGAIVLFLILLAYYQKQKAKKNRIIHDQEVKTLVAKEETAAARALLEGQEEERKRVALELHDGLGVMLSSVKMQFTNFIARHSQHDEVLNQAAMVLDKAAVDVRRISHNMMPGVLTKFGLNISLEELMDHLNENEGVEASVNIKGDDKKLTDNIQIMVYRIIQELVNNTIKHARASQVSLILDYGTEELSIIYSDNGVGFTIGVVAHSLGLRSIESRVRFLGGDLSIESKPGKGASFLITIPLG